MGLLELFLHSDGVWRDHVMAHYILLHEWGSKVLEQHASCVSHRHFALMFLDIYSI
jgi:hypothetical protein